MEPSRRRKRQDLIEEHEKNTKDLCSGKAPKTRFVIKQLHQKLLADPKLFRRAVKDLATEVSIMSILEHPNIAQVHATAVGGIGAMTKSGKHDSYFLVLDRLEQTLDDRIEAWNQEKIKIGPSYYLDSATNDTKMALKANYALQIASALWYLHKQRIVFRDLKPQNIGFKEVHPDHPERDVLALFDFGLSRKLPSPEKANSDGLFRMSMVGTRRYMAPEVVTSKWYDARADVYSWSLVFFELVCQARPYDGIQRGEHKQFICVEGKRPKIYSYYGFPPDLERLLRFGWAQEVSKRVTMGEVCETLEAYLSGTIHEECVRQNKKPTVIHDDSVSSLISYSTEQTELTLSTTNSFTLDDTKPRPHDSSETGAAVGADTVPQAIAVSSGSPLSSQPPENEDGYPRRVSLCERCMGVFRGSLTKGFGMFR
jgi:serine/threonine protein kinase